MTKKAVKKIAKKKAPAKEEIAVIFDTETTGLVQNRTIPLEKQPEVIEFYACAADLISGKIKDEVNLLIRPAKMPIPPEITKITGITTEMLMEQSPFATHADLIFSVLETAPYVIAHNASFDRDMIEIEAARLGRTIAWPRVVCTVEQTIAMKGFRLNLSGLHEHLFGEAFKGAHRAREDVAALLRCAVELKRRDVL